MLKIAVDAMGGDRGLEMVLDAVLNYLDKYKDTQITLFGDEVKIKERLNNKNFTNLEIIHSSEKLASNIENVSLLIRNNKEASMLKAMHNIDSYDAFISAGPTQALIAGTHFIIGRLKGVQRIAYAPIIPNLNADFKVLLDAGANTTLTAEQLNNLAIGGSLYYKVIFNKENPKVCLLNIGEEDNKGREIDIETNNLLKNNQFINFVGNQEPDVAFNSDANVILADGFIGNIFLKTLEGFYKGLKGYLKDNLIKKFRNKMGLLLLKKDLKALKEQVDPSKVGGAILLGARKIVIKVHGGASSDSFYSGLELITKLFKNNFIEQYQKAVLKDA